MRLIDLQLFAEEKTEEATPHRLQEVRKKGQAARSNDLSASLVLLALVLFIYWQRESFWAVAWRLLSTFLALPRRELDADNLITVFYLGLAETGPILLLLFGVAAAAGLAANWAQVGFIFSTDNLVPRLENLDPVKGFQRLFSRRSLVELAKGVAKVIVIGAVVWQVVRSEFQKLFLAPEMGLLQVAEETAGIVFEAALKAAVVYLVLGILDFVYQRREFLRSLRMTKEEVKEELKQTEGDPLVRSRLREKQRKLARHRMMHAVPEATVVITNPVHLAVALKYREEEGAPRVVAKGAGSIAFRIVEVARQHGVPVVQNPPVAQALYRKVEIGEEIPVELYQAVAEILAYIYRMQGHW
ncbi:MAG: flagellar biosynthesis protein FlhB [Thermanaeromonas sp.]|uniref:flagellar biosynthesis protein FlhB n=1 Tax=Thermanaeromonas sp. TaxID=2003697 RepID=UPI0024394A2F|nr:flagellar biosynthesis protein FlhB [Thermanaeromonas sp.]MCG0278131.1 flagellar biosynthesis protein FlhB [Thermanaeromonas sp.]